MKKFFDYVKVECLFCGTIIGAGFATGREISLYFNAQSLYGTMLGGIGCGLMCVLFMFVGKFNISLVGQKIFDIVFFIASAISFAAMFAGAESIIFSHFRLSNAGIISAVFCLYLATKDIGALKIANFLIVGIIIILLMVLSTGLPFIDRGGNFSILPSLWYGGLNILICAKFAIEQGREMTSSGIWITGAITSIALSVMIMFIYFAIDGFETLPMPLYSSALSSGKGLFATFVIYLAILSTMLSAVRILFNYVKDWSNDNQQIATLSIILFGVCVGSYSFEFIVNKFYFITSMLGIAFTVIAITKIFYYKASNIKINKKMKKSIS